MRNNFVAELMLTLAPTELKTDLDCVENAAQFDEWYAVDSNRRRVAVLVLAGLWQTRNLPLGPPTPSHDPLRECSVALST